MSKHTIMEPGEVSDEKQRQEEEEEEEEEEARKRRRRRVVVVVVLLFLLLLTVLVIIAITVFRPKDPKIKVVSVTVDGVAPRVSFPAVKIEVNVSVDLEILVNNPNYASFKHGAGKSQVLYLHGAGNNEVEVGEVEISAGRIPAKGSETLRCRLNLEAENFLSDMSNLINDVLAGEIMIETRTRIPGRLKLLGIFSKHAIAVSDCHIAIGVPDLKIRRQDCKHKTKMM